VDKGKTEAEADSSSYSKPSGLSTYDLLQACEELSIIAVCKKLKCLLLGEYLAIWNWNPCREAPRDGVSGRPCSLAEMAIPDAVVRRHATNKVLVVEDGRRARRIPFSIAYHSLSMRSSHFIKSWLEWWLIREAAMNYGP